MKHFILFWLWFLALMYDNAFPPLKWVLKPILLFVSAMKSFESFFVLYMFTLNCLLFSFIFFIEFAQCQKLHAGSIAFLFYDNLNFFFNVFVDYLKSICIMMLCCMKWLMWWKILAGIMHYDSSFPKRFMHTLLLLLYLKFCVLCTACFEVLYLLPWH